jgi:sulfur relay (sulfurtransferase) complex TusBCD TusD component (DsrE family)
LQARGLFDAELIDGTEFGTLKHLSDWMINDDKVIVF